MFEFLKKAAKPIAMAATLIAGALAAVWLADPKNGLDIHFDPFMDTPDEPKEQPKGKEYAMLRAEDLQQLRWMSVGQLHGIFDKCRGQFKIESSPDAYRQLRWMSQEQIRAIFGTDDIPES